MLLLSVIINICTLLLSSDVKSFFCEECGLSFKLRTSLQKHLVHRHERAQNNHACTDCGKIFSKRIHLTNHRAKEHQLEKNFLCQVLFVYIIL